MERLTKTLVATLIIAFFVTGCATRTVAKIIEPPKPTVDSRILLTCDISLTPLRVDPPASPEDLFVSYAEAITYLNSCACRQREARNALCALTSPGCAVVKPCEKVKDDTTAK